MVITATLFFWIGELMTTKHIETVWSAHVTAEMVKGLSDGDQCELFAALDDMVAHICAEFGAN